MRIVYDEESIKSFLDEVHSVSRGHPVLIDKFLEDAQEVDVDAICDGKDVYVAGVMEHIENAGIHSGDSACVLPPHTLSAEVIKEIKSHTVRLAHALKVVGLMNIQFAVKGRQVYVLEVNPRASRTAPFVSKATGMPLAKIAAQIMAGKKLSDFKLVNPGGIKIYLCQRISLAFQPFFRGRYYFRAGNEIHRRGHGDRLELWRGLCQISNGGQSGLAQRGDGFYQCQ